MRKATLWLLVLLLSGFGLGMGGCETTEGFGRDLEKAGEGLQDEAREHK